MDGQCPEHPDEKVKYYCRSHDQLCCEACILQSHDSCGSVIFIEEEFNYIGNKLTDVEEQADIKIKTATKRIEEIENNISEQTDDMKQFIIEIIDFFAQLEKGMVQTLNKLKNAEISKIAAISDKCDKVKSHVQTLTSDLASVHKTKDVTQMFAVMQTVKLKVRTMEETLNVIEKENKIVSYEFKKGPEITAMMEDVNILGDISIREDSTDTMDQPDGRLRMKASEEIRERQAEHVADIKIKSPTDSLFRSCMITDSVLLSDGQLVITDCINWKVKVIDTKQSEIGAELSLSSGPLSITDVNKTQVAVTLPKENKIQFLSISEDFACLTEGDKIGVHGTCRCLAHNNGTLIVSFLKPAKVDIIDFNGTILKTISTCPDGQPLFVSPKYLTLSPNGSSIYVCDSYTHSVICLALDGTVTTTYRYNGIKGPRGLTVDKDDGSLFLCCLKSHTVHLIGDYMDEGQILLGQKDGISYPYSIAYDHSEHKLYVAMYDNNVKVYQIQYL